jgi:hypothetical protein
MFMYYILSIKNRTYFQTLEVCYQCALTSQEVYGYSGDYISDMEGGKITPHLVYFRVL